MARLHHNDYEVIQKMDKELYCLFYILNADLSIDSNKFAIKVFTIMLQFERHLKKSFYWKVRARFKLYKRYLSIVNIIKISFFKFNLEGYVYMKFKIVGIEQYSFIQAEQKKNTFTPPTTVQKRVTSYFSSEKVIVNHTRETLNKMTLVFSTLS